MLYRYALLYVYLCYVIDFYDLSCLLCHPTNNNKLLQFFSFLTYKYNITINVAFYCTMLVFIGELYIMRCTVCGWWVINKIIYTEDVCILI